MALKLTNADKWISKAIREANHWTCQKCGVVSPEGQATGGDRFIQHSHFIGRQHKATRYDAENGLCLCATCHATVEVDPGLHTRLFTQINGEGLAEILTEKKNKAFKPLEGWKEYEKSAAKHYREEFNRLRGLRKEGKMGRIEITSYE